jgi:hypothetical protein
MVLAEAKQAIKRAWIAGVISGVITLMFTLIVMRGTQIPGVSAWTLVDVVLVFGLSYGIYRKNRVCAVVMLVYFAISKVYMMVVSGRVVGIGLGLVFMYLFFKGIIGTLEYHRLIKEERTPDYRVR